MVLWTPTIFMAILLSSKNYTIVIQLTIDEFQRGIHLENLFLKEGNRVVLIAVLLHILYVIINKVPLWWKR